MAFLYYSIKNHDVLMQETSVSTISITSFFTSYRVGGTAFKFQMSFSHFRIEVIRGVAHLTKTWDSPKWDIHCVLNQQLPDVRDLGKNVVWVGRSRVCLVFYLKFIIRWIKENQTRQNMNLKRQTLSLFQDGADELSSLPFLSKSWLFILINGLSYYICFISKDLYEILFCIWANKISVNQ